MGNCDLPEVPKYIAGFIEYKHRFNKEFKVEDNFANICIDAISYEYPNERIEKYITKNPNTFAKAYLIGYKIKGEDR